MYICKVPHFNISFYLHISQIILWNYFKQIQPWLVNMSGLRAKTNDFIIFAVIHKGFGCPTLIMDILLKKISLCPEAWLLLASNYRINPEVKQICFAVKEITVSNRENFSYFIDSA